MVKSNRSNLTAHDHQVWFSWVKDETRGALIFALRSLSVHQYSYNAGRWPKRQPCRPRNTCYTQWSNLSKVMRKTGLSHTRGHIEIAFTEPSRTLRACSKAEDSSREKTGIQLRSRKKEVPYAPFLSWQFFPLSSSYDVSRYAFWWVYFDNGREQVRRTAWKNESREYV